MRRTIDLLLGCSTLWAALASGCGERSDSSPSGGEAGADGAPSASVQLCQGNFVPCGGDLVADWRLTAWCPETDPLADLNCGALAGSSLYFNPPHDRRAYPCSSSSRVGLNPENGGLTEGGDDTTFADVCVSGRVDYPSECNPSADPNVYTAICDPFEAAFRALVPDINSYLGSRGRDECGAELRASDIAYAVENDEFVSSNKARSAYCVEGDTATLRVQDADGAYSRITLTRR